MKKETFLLLLIFVVILLGIGWYFGERSARQTMAFNDVQKKTNELEARVEPLERDLATRQRLINWLKRAYSAIKGKIPLP